MKITVINTSDLRGGAAIAASRLFRTLRKDMSGVRMLVRDRIGKTEDVTAVSSSSFSRLIAKLRFYLEIICFIPGARNREAWFAYSPGRFGQDISDNILVREADILHLNWINGGFLKVRDIKKLLSTGKPVVWTLHDMWAFTGGCHYPGSCKGYLAGCGNCPFLKRPGSDDLSSRLHREKMNLLASGKVSFIAVSSWMAETARNSSILRNSRIVVIPNPINTEVFTPADRISVRRELGLPEKRFIILSGAANLKDKRKGFALLLDALRILRKDTPAEADRFLLLTFGKPAEITDPPVEMRSLSYLSNESEIARLYQAADVFVLPSLEDNLPSTVMEALACGTPAVAFRLGGIPDMVDHLENGYLAEPGDPSDLLKGIRWIAEHPSSNTPGQKSREKVLENFSPRIILEKHHEFYKSLVR